MAIKITGKLLDLSKKQFKVQETGQEVDYYRLKLMDEEGNVMDLKIGAEVYEEGIQSNTAFGEEIEVTAVQRKNNAGFPELRVIKW